MVAPFIVGNALGVATLSYEYLPMLYGYLLLMGIGLIIYYGTCIETIWSLVARQLC
jgi:hypothetical protein